MSRSGGGSVRIKRGAKEEHIYIYIYIYIEREREVKRKREERERERKEQILAIIHTLPFTHTQVPKSFIV